MTTLNLPKFGKIKIDGEWCDFHESSVITGTISDDCCEIKIEEFKPKMNTYKIISGETYPTLEKLMGSQSEVKSASLREACCEFMKPQLKYKFFGYFLHVETLDLFYVQYFRELDGREYFKEFHKGKLEKPKMKKYKIIPNQNKHSDSITYEFMMNHFTVESDSPVNAFRKYCECNSFVINLDSNFGYVLDAESLDLYYTSWSINEQIGHSSFVMKLENPIEKPKMNKLIRVKSLLTNNVRYFYNSSSNFKNELQSVPKSILLNHKPYEYSPDCIKVNDLLQFIFDDYSTLSYVVTEITYEEDCVSKYESVNKEKEPLQKLMDKHKVRPDAWINNQDYATNAMIVGLVQILSPLFIKKPNQKLITLQDLNNGKVYTRPFTSGLDSITLQEFSKLIVNDATVMKTLQNGKDYEGFNVNVGDMIQFSDDRNVLYSLRVTKIE